MVLKVTKALEAGTGTPAVARLGPGVMDLLRFTDLSRDHRDRVASCAWDVVQILVPTQKLAKEVLDELDQIQATLDREGLRVQGSGTAIEVPSAMKLDKAADFVVRAKKVLVRAMESIELFWGKKFPEAYYHQALEWARTALGPDAPLTRLLSDDQKWIKHIIDLRNEEEHPKHKPFLRNFDVKLEPGRAPVVVLPHFYDGTSVRDVLTVYGEDLLTFVEELIVLGISEHLASPQVVVAEIPAPDRDPAMPVRFKVVLTPEAASRLADARGQGMPKNPGPEPGKKEPE